MTSEDAEEASGVWIAQLAFKGIIFGEDNEGLNRLGNAVGALRELKGREQLPAGCEPLLRSLEKMWTTAKKAGAVRGEPRITDKKLISKFLEWTTGRSPSDLLQDIEVMTSTHIEPAWVAQVLVSVARAKKEGRAKTKWEAFDIVRATIKELGMERDEPFAISAAIIARLGAMNVAMRKKPVAVAVAKVLKGVRGQNGVAEAVARTPLLIRRQKGWGVEEINLYFDPDELRAKLDAAELTAAEIQT